MKHCLIAHSQLRKLMTSPDTLRRLSFAIAPMVFVAVSLLLSHNAAAVSRTWDGGGATNNWSEAANWSGDTVPGTDDVAVFDGTSTKNVTIDVNITVQGIQINAGYTNTGPGTGTITQSGNSITIGSAGFFQSSGTFTGGSGDIDINGNFDIDGGTFTASSGTTFFGAQFASDLPGGTFNHNGGTVVFDGVSVDSRAGVPVTLNNLIVNKPSGNFFTLGGTIFVTGTLTLTDGVFLAGVIEARGPVVVDSTFDGGGSGAQLNITDPASPPPSRTITFNAGVQLLNLRLNSATTTINTTGTGTLTWQNVTLQAGTIQQGANVAFAFNGNTYNQSGGTFTGSASPITFGTTSFQFQQSGGTFTGGSGDSDLNGNFELEGGTFTASSGNTFIAGGFRSDLPGGTFNPNGGTVVLDGNGSFDNNFTGVTFNNLTFNKSGGAIVFLDSTAVAAATLTLADGFVNAGTLEARGAVVVGPNFDGSNAALTFTGTMNQTFTNNGGPNPTGAWTVNKSAGALTLLSDLILQSTQPLTIAAGLFNQGASANVTIGSLTVAAGATYRNFGTGDLTLGGNVSNSGTLELDGGGSNCGDADSILIRSSAPGTQRLWSGMGTFRLQDVDVQDQAGDAALTVFSSTDSGNNGPNWSFSAGCAPTEVTLVSFIATAHDDGRVLLMWQTGYEADNLGFNIYREEAGGRTRINPSLVGGSALITGLNTRLTAGWSYSWLDKSHGDTQAQYWLEDVDLKGVSTWHGPVTVQKAEGGRQKAEGRAETRSKLLSELGNGEAHDTSWPSERRAAGATIDAASFAAQATLASQPAAKITVKHEGWYRMTQSELAAAGFDTKINPRKLQLLVEGREVPIEVQGEEDGSFDAGDAIEFYGVGLESPFTESRVYWLVEGNQSGQRVNRTKTEAEPTPSQSFTATVERRDRTVYFSGLRNGEKENFFGAVIAREPVEQQLTLPHLARTASSDAQLEIALQGVTLNPHRVIVELNGAYVGEVVFNGQSESKATIKASQSLLREGANMVRLTGVTGQTDASLVAYIRIGYQHSYTADGNTLKLTAPGFQQITIDGFTGGSIRVVDVTDPDAPQEIIGAIERQKAGYAISFAATEAGERSLLAFTAEQQPASLSLNVPSNLRAGSADFIVVTRREFADALRPLVTLRKKQGLSVSLVDIEDVYDEFSFGQKSPYAIRDFLSYAELVWKKKPRFVLFAGDASFDPKNYLGFGDSDLVPTRLIDTDLMETSSDDWLSDFNGDGIADIATGRLPARTVEELSRMVGKIVSYEQAAPSDEALLVADANEGFDFEQASTDLMSLIPTNLRITQVNRGRLDPEMARSSLFEAVYRKQFLVNYAGHGSVNQWRGNLLTNDDALALRNDHLPMFVMMTCLNGYFQDPVLDSLGESLLKAERGGAVAVWASSGMTLPTDQTLLNQELYRLMFNRGQTMTIGEAVIRAKAASSDSDVRRTWILLGDPAMKLK